MHHSDVSCFCPQSERTRERERLEPRVECLVVGFSPLLLVIQQPLDTVHKGVGASQPSRLAYSCRDRQLHVSLAHLCCCSRPSRGFVADASR